MGMLGVSVVRGVGQRSLRLLADVTSRTWGAHKAHRACAVWGAWPCQAPSRPVFDPNLAQVSGASPPCWARHPGIEAKKHWKWSQHPQNRGEQCGQCGVVRRLNWLAPSIGLVGRRLGSVGGQLAPQLNPNDTQPMRGWGANTLNSVFRVPNPFLALVWPKCKVLGSGFGSNLRM